jgi:hypothetical protein
MNCKFCGGVIYRSSGKWVMTNGMGCTSRWGDHEPYPEHVQEFIQEVDPDLERLLAEEEEIERRQKDAMEQARRDEDKRMRDEYVQHRARLRELIAELRDQHDEAILAAHEAYAATQDPGRGFIEHFAYANGLMLAISSLEKL